MSNIFGGLSSNGGEGNDMDDTCGGFSLTKTQRLYGFGIAFAAGFVISILGSVFLFLGNITTFAVLYTLGNICSIMSTGFLVGPLRQCKNMFDKTRLIATLIFFTLMILTLIVAISLGKSASGAVLVLVILQWISLIWYSASYIPFARAAIRNCLGGLF